MKDDTAYVTLTQALTVSGHPTKGALAKFICRFNKRASPPDRILRTHRTVEIQSLKRALRIHAERGTKQ